MDYPISGMIAVCGFMLSATWAAHIYLINLVSENQEKLGIAIQKMADLWLHLYRVIFANLACIVLFLISMSTGSILIQTVTTYICFFVSLKVIVNILFYIGSFNAYSKVLAKLTKPYNGRNAELWKRYYQEWKFSSKVALRYLAYLEKKARGLHPTACKFKLKKVSLSYVNSNFALNFILNIVLIICAMLIINPLRGFDDKLNAISIINFTIGSQEMKNLVWLYSLSTIYVSYQVVKGIPEIDKIISNSVKSEEYYSKQMGKAN